jgi:hypothetical protein
VQHNQPTTIAILGADTVVGHALCALLENAGYDIAPVDAYPTGVVDELLDGSDLLLLVPRLDEGVRESFLGVMGKSAPQKGEMPVISLSTAPTTEALPERGILSVPWPCSMEDLVGQIEAALAERASSDYPCEGATSTG